MPDAIAATDGRFHDLGVVSKLLAREGFKVIQMAPEPYLAAASDSTHDEELWSSLEVMSASHGLTTSAYTSRFKRTFSAPPWRMLSQACLEPASAARICMCRDVARGHRVLTLSDFAAL